MLTQRQYLMAVGTAGSIGFAGCGGQPQNRVEPSGELSQSQAEQIGQEASVQVTNRLVEDQTVGTVENGEITEVDLTMQRAPGSANIDLESVTMQWVTNDINRNLVLASSGNTSAVDGVFSYAVVNDDDSSISAKGILNSDADRVILTIGLDGSPTGSLNAPLEADQTVTVVVSTQSGGETTLTWATPDTLSGKDSVEL